MPYKCCVPKCRGNYPNGPKVCSIWISTGWKSKKKMDLCNQKSRFFPITNKQSKQFSLDSVLLFIGAVYIKDISK